MFHTQRHAGRQLMWCRLVFKLYAYMNRTRNRRFGCVCVCECVFVKPCHLAAALPCRRYCIESLPRSQLPFPDFLNVTYFRLIEPWMSNANRTIHRRKSYIHFESTLLDIKRVAAALVFPFLFSNATLMNRIIIAIAELPEPKHLLIIKWTITIIMFGPHSAHDTSKIPTRECRRKKEPSNGEIDGESKYVGVRQWQNSST